ncbi:hypothetical protein INR49_018727 [Caranx melampygus]|nr:hypothetical protein INR49_018727 [Caranx melampygus]
MLSLDRTVTPGSELGGDDGSSTAVGTCYLKAGLPRPGTEGGLLAPSSPAGVDPSATVYTQACQPGKSLLRFLGSMACCMSRLTCPPTLSTVPSSTPFSFSCSRSSTRSATLLKL